MRKLKKISLAAICMVFATLQVFAQVGEVPCSGDPDDPGYDPNGCNTPLDNWVIVLVIAGLIFATLYLHNKQKKEATLS